MAKVLELYEKKLLTIAEASQLYGMSPGRLMALIKSDLGYGFCLNDGGIYRIQREVFEEWLLTNKFIPSTEALEKRERDDLKYDPEIHVKPKQRAGLQALLLIFITYLNAQIKALNYCKAALEKLLVDGVVNIEDL